MRFSDIYGLPIAEEGDVVKQFPTTVDAPRTEGIDAALDRLSFLVGGKKILIGTTVTAVSGNGGITVNFGYTFAAVPIFIAVLGDETANATHLQIAGASITVSSAAVRIKSGQNNVPSGTFRVNWLAAGTPV